MKLMDLSLEEFKTDYLIPALRNFMEVDICSNHSLPSTNVWEVVYSVRIAMHLRAQMLTYEKDGFYIDCEYNKRAGKEKSSTGVTKHRNMRPDIIIHKRADQKGNFQEGNYLFCEVKIKERSKWDARKVKAGVNKYHYKLGLCISNISSSGLRLEWFVKDTMVSQLPMPNPEDYIF